MQPVNQIRQAVRLLGACCSALPLAACTIVHIEGPAKVTRHYPGTLAIAPAEGSDMIVYRSRGVGLVPGLRGATLGYADETVVALQGEEACRIVLFDPDRENVAALAALLRPVVGADQICSVGG